MSSCSYAKNIFILFISDAIVRINSHRVTGCYGHLLVSWQPLLTLQRRSSSPVLNHPYQCPTAPPILLLHWSQRLNEVVFLMPPSTITSLFVSWASVSCWRLAWAYDPTPTECFLPFKPPYIKGSRAGHMPLCVLMPLQTKNPCGQSQLMLNEVENNNPRTRAATVT